jgi:hypothetical protein
VAPAESQLGVHLRLGRGDQNVGLMTYLINACNNNSRPHLADEAARCTLFLPTT